MANPGQELASIDFESMIGGPLVAVINAQAQAAMSTINFIKQVGFKPGADNQTPDAAETGEPIYVKFRYPKEISPYQPPSKDADGNDVAAVPAVYQTQELEVPLLTMVPIPYIRIEEATIDFKAKINSMEYRKTDDHFKIDASLEAKAGWLWGSAKLTVSTSYQKNTQAGNEVNRTYSLDIHVKATQDEMPAGMEKLLGILEDAIKGKPAAA